MKIRLAGFDGALEVERGKATVLEVTSPALFARICQSFVSGMGEYSIEPYLVWDDSEKEIRPVDTIKVVPSVLSLPWTDKEFIGSVYAQMELMLNEDDALKQDIIYLHNEIASKVMNLSFQLQSDYSFAVEWEMRKFLKTFGFSSDISYEDKLLDNVIKFLKLAADTCLNKTLVFINFKTFFSEKELNTIYEQVFFYGNKIVLLECIEDKRVFKSESKMRIDQDLLQE